MLITEQERAIVELATEEEDEAGGVTDRSYWETGKGSPLSLDLADDMLALIREKTHAGLNLKYNKFYVPPADLIDMLTLNPDAGRQVVRVLGELEAGETSPDV